VKPLPAEKPDEGPLTKCKPLPRKVQLNFIEAEPPLIVLCGSQASTEASESYSDEIVKKEPFER